MEYEKKRNDYMTIWKIKGKGSFLYINKDIFDILDDQFLKILTDMELKINKNDQELNINCSPFYLYGNLNVK